MGNRAVITTSTAINVQASKDIGVYIHWNGGEAYVINERSFLRVMLYWADEVNDFNNDRFSEQFGDRLEQQHIGVYYLRVRALE